MDDTSLASFRDQLRKKLADLNETQHSVQTVSEWVMFHQTHAEDGVAMWDEELRKASHKRKLAFLFLCNDIIQNSRKKTNRFIEEFSRVLPVSLGHVYNFNGDDEKTQKRVRSSIERLVAVWADRSLFDSEFIDKLREELEIEELPDPATKVKSKAKGKVKKKKHTKSKKKDKKKGRKEKSKSKSKTKDKDDDVSPATSNHPVVKALIELENDAVEDAVVAVKVAGLTPEIPSMTSPAMIRKALEAFTKHRGRLQVNIRRRKQLLESLKECLKNQENLITRTTQELEECNSELNTLRTRVSGSDIMTREELAEAESALPPNTGLPLESSSVGAIDAKEEDMDLDTEMTLGEEQEQELLLEQQRRQEQQDREEQFQQQLQQQQEQQSLSTPQQHQQAPPQQHQSQAPSELQLDPHQHTDQQHQTQQSLPPQHQQQSQAQETSDQSDSDQYQLGQEFDGTDDLEPVTKRPKLDTSDSSLSGSSNSTEHSLSTSNYELPGSLPFPHPQNPLNSFSSSAPLQLVSQSSPPGNHQVIAPGNHQVIAPGNHQVTVPSSLPAMALSALQSLGPSIIPSPPMRSLTQSSFSPPPPPPPPSSEGNLRAFLSPPRPPPPRPPPPPPPNFMSNQRNEWNPTPTASPDYSLPSPPPTIHPFTPSPQHNIQSPSYDIR